MGVLGKTLKSLGKALLQSRLSARPGRSAAPGRELVVLANGPSLTQSLAERPELLRGRDLLTVNFSLLEPAIRALRPRWHMMADPYFFATGGADPRVARLWAELGAMGADAPTLLVPAGARLPEGYAGTVARFNMVGAEGIPAVTQCLFAARLAMPRPRNVLIPAIMCGLWMGYRRIWLLGADHSWTRTLTVGADNRTLNHQPHFYADSAAEKARVEAQQAVIPIHRQLESFAIAFRAYHDIAAWTRHTGAEIVNATPGSFIDAFPRG